MQVIIDRILVYVRKKKCKNGLNAYVRKLNSISNVNSRYAKGLIAENGENLLFKLIFFYKNLIINFQILY